MPEPDPVVGPWTPLRILQWAVPFLRTKGVANPKLESEILLAHCLGIDRLKVYLQFDRPLGEAELSRLREVFRKRGQREPFAYLAGYREFFGLRFQVTPQVLIPRPETEHLVEGALEFLRNRPPEARFVLDLGTGSGCVVLSLAYRETGRFWGVDISEGALQVAQDNARSLGIETSVIWRKGDWFKALSPGDPEKFDLIVSNPPYIPETERQELEPEVRDHEPSQALFGGEDGLEAYRNLADSLEKRLVPGGAAYLEVHSTLWEGAWKMFEKGGWSSKQVLKDLQGRPRILRLEKSPHASEESAC